MSGRRDRDPRPYYEDKRDSLRDLFGATTVGVETNRIVVDGREYPVLDDVILLLPRTLWPAAVSDRLEPAILARFEHFWQCGDCGRVYWRGSHYVHLLQRLRDAGAAPGGDGDD